MKKLITNEIYFDYYGGLCLKVQAETTIYQQNNKQQITGKVSDDFGIPVFGAECY